MSPALMDWLTANWGALGFAIVIVAAVAMMAVKLWPLFRKLGHFLDDVAGEPARPGVEARPGLMERLARIEHEVFQNSGSSLRDRVDQTAQQVTEVSAAVQTVSYQLEEVAKRLDDVEDTIPEERP